MLQRIVDNVGVTLSFTGVERSAGWNMPVGIFAEICLFVATFIAECQSLIVAYIATEFNKAEVLIGSCPQYFIAVAILEVISVGVAVVGHEPPVVGQTTVEADAVLLTVIAEIIPFYRAAKRFVLIQQVVDVFRFKADGAANGSRATSGFTCAGLNFNLLQQGWIDGNSSDVMKQGGGLRSAINGNIDVIVFQAANINLLCNTQ